MLINFLKKNYFISFIIFSGVPLFFIPNSWDGSVFNYGFILENFSGIKSFLTEIGSPFQLVFIYFIFLLKKLTLLPHEFLFDLFTSVILILFSFEIKKYAEIVFKLENKFSNLCAIFAITFPVWHSLAAINLGLYLACFYFALLGYRLFISKNTLTKIIGSELTAKGLRATKSTVGKQVDNQYASYNQQHTDNRRKIQLLTEQ